MNEPCDHEANLEDWEPTGTATTKRGNCVKCGNPGELIPGVTPQLWWTTRKPS
jgi:hypothetical protein